MQPPYRAHEGSSARELSCQGASGMPHRSRGIPFATYLQPQAVFQLHRS